ncbi:MAG: V-type ATP synthase subunit E family protein, partial [Candidatus Bathyarchaeia archaeon]
RMLQVKAEALNKIFAKAMEKISKMTHEPRYRKFLHSAVVEAILKIPGSEYVVTANERDRETLQKDLKEIEERLREAGRPEVKIQVSNDRLDSVGGVLVYNKAAQKYFNNTVEARFIQAQTRLKGRLYRQLFGGKPDAR